MRIPLGLRRVWGAQPPGIAGRPGGAAPWYCRGSGGRSPPALQGVRGAQPFGIAGVWGAQPPGIAGGPGGACGGVGGRRPLNTATEAVF